MKMFKYIFFYILICVTETVNVFFMYCAWKYMIHIQSSVKIFGWQLPFSFTEDDVSVACT